MNLEEFIEKNKWMYKEHGKINEDKLVADYYARYKPEALLDISKSVLTEYINSVKEHDMITEQDTITHSFIEPLIKKIKPYNLNSKDLQINDLAYVRLLVFNILDSFVKYKRLSIHKKFSIEPEYLAELKEDIDRIISASKFDATIIFNVHEPHFKVWEELIMITSTGEEV